MIPIAETPNPTSAQYWANANKADGRISIGLRELKRRLETNLPPLIDYANTQLGRTTDDVKIRKPEFYTGAPVGSHKGKLNGVLMGVSNDAEFQGNAQFKNTYTVSIYTVDQKIETELQYWNHWDRAGLIRVALHGFLSGCIDVQNRVCWRSLVPQQTGVETADWETYGGLYLFYKMTCDPSQNTWS